MRGLLRDLAKMNINRENPGRPVLGDKKNVQDQEVQNGRLLLKKTDTDIIIVSDDEQQWGGGVPGPAEQRVTKAARITKLTQAAGQAMDNRVLAQITADFVKVLQSSNSRTLTREGFAFLDALHKQLADPSVFIVPLRSSKATRSSRSQGQEPKDLPVEERRSRLNVLRASVAKAQDNKSLAKLIAEFGTLIDKAAGRKLTKDGLAFLEHMADRLLVVRV
jgi:casein kinase 1